MKVTVARLECDGVILTRSTRFQTTTDTIVHFSCITSTVEILRTFASHAAFRDPFRDPGNVDK